MYAPDPLLATVPADGALHGHDPRGRRSERHRGRERQLVDRLLRLHRLRGAGHVQADVGRRVLRWARALGGAPHHGAGASTVYGDLNSFDAVNDTGRECRGFQIEIHGARSSDVTHTCDWNHYGAPRITEDFSDPANPRVLIRCESPKNPDGSWSTATRTDVPTQTLTPTDGHFCTDTSNYSYGCVHCGVGHYGAPSPIKYNWLHGDGTGACSTTTSADKAVPVLGNRNVQALCN